MGTWLKKLLITFFSLTFACSLNFSTLGGYEDNVRIDHIQSSYRIVDLPQLIDSMKPLGMFAHLIQHA
jgi:hypothetical protein